MKPDPEFLPKPGTLVCESYVRVRFHEIDALGHVNNAAYLNYLEQAAIDHAALLGLNLAQLRELGGVFVARRHEIVFLRSAHAGNVLRIVTWLGEPHGARVERRYVIFLASNSGEMMPIGGRIVDAGERAGQDAKVVQAATEWVFTSERGQPRRIPSEVARAFRPSGSSQGAGEETR